MDRANHNEQTTPQPPAIAPAPIPDNPPSPEIQSNPCAQSAPGSIEKAIACEPSVFKRCWKVLGPGLTGGASNNDPSAIATYAKAGASLGFSTLWVVPLLFPMMAASVYLAAKLAMVSGHGLAGVLREYYSRWLLFPVVIALIAANVFNAGLDIGAVAAGIQMILPIPRPLAIIGVTLLILMLQIWGSYQLLTSTFKWLTLTLFAFIAAGLLAKPDPSQVLSSTLIPTVHLDRAFLSTLVAMFGTSLSPYLFFWQTGQRVEEELCAGRTRLWQRKGVSDGELKYASWDINTGMFFACLIIYFIILATAATLYVSNRHDIQSAADAAYALRPFAGRFASALFAAGFVGAGLLAVPVLTTGAAYALSETFQWKFGLGRRPTAAPQFYLAIVAFTLLGMLINFLGLNVMTGLFLAAVFNGILTPVVLIIIVHASRRRLIMNKHRARPSITLLGLLASLFTTAATLAMLLSLW
ncbi:MAG: NRAMP family divalent metal transporter [Bacillota bacterium]